MFDHKTQQVDIQLTTVPFTKPAAREDQRDGRFEMEMDEDWTTDRQQEQETALVGVKNHTKYRSPHFTFLDCLIIWQKNSAGYLTQPFFDGKG